MLQNRLIDSESQNTSCFDLFWFDCDQLKSSVVSNFYPSNLLSRVLCSMFRYSIALQLFATLQIFTEPLAARLVHSRVFLHQHGWGWIILIIRGLRRLFVSLIHSSMHPGGALAAAQRTSFTLKSSSFSYRILIMQEIYNQFTKPTSQYTPKHRGMKMYDSVHLNHCTARWFMNSFDNL